MRHWHIYNQKELDPNGIDLVATTVTARDYVVKTLRMYRPEGGPTYYEKCDNDSGCRFNYA